MNEIEGKFRSLDGVGLRSLTTFSDHRGSLTELLRSSAVGRDITQVNWVTSDAGTLRGVHLHLRHADLITVPVGRAVIGLYDCRPESPTFATAGQVVLKDANAVLVIPVGVAHGFWFPSGGSMLYGLDHEWDSNDELGCRWDDADLGIRWDHFGDGFPNSQPGFPLVSTRDSAAGTLREMMAQFASSRSIQSTPK